MYDSTTSVLTEMLSNLPKVTQQVKLKSKTCSDSNTGEFPRLFLGRVKRQDRKAPRCPAQKKSNPDELLGLWEDKCGCNDKGFFL